MNADQFSALLDGQRPALARYLSRHAGPTLAHETVEDLVQGVLLRALSAAQEFEYRSEPEFEAWVIRVADSHLLDQRAHWAAAKRRPERLLHLTHPDSDSTDPRAVREPAHPTTGPATKAGRAEQLRMAQEALTLLLPRDAGLVEGHAADRSLDDEAARLGISYEAAQRARHRALERYRRAFLLLSRGDGP